MKDSRSDHQIDRATTLLGIRWHFFTLSHTSIEQTMYSKYNGKFKIKIFFYFVDISTCPWSTNKAKVVCCVFLWAWRLEFLKRNEPKNLFVNIWPKLILQLKKWLRHLKLIFEAASVIDSNQYKGHLITIKNVEISLLVEKKLVSESLFLFWKNVT